MNTPLLARLPTRGVLLLVLILVSHVKAATVTLSASSLSFGSQFVGLTSAPQSITVTYSGTGTDSLLGLTITGANSADYALTTNCPTTFITGDSCAISATFTPTAPGVRAASISFTNNPGSVQTTISLSGAGTAALTGVTYPVGPVPTSLAFDGTNIWVTNFGTDPFSNSFVSKLLPSNGTVLQTFTVGRSPFGIVFDGTNVWITNYAGNLTSSAGNNVSKLLASTGASVGLYSAGKNPTSIAFDGVNIWVANSGEGSVTKLLASTGAIVGTYQVGAYPDSVVFDGVNVWVANTQSNNVTRLLAATGAIVGTYAVGAYPDGTLFDGQNIWVANSGNNSVTKLSASTGSVLGTYLVGPSPAGMAFDGTNIWVANGGSNTVAQLRASTGAVVGSYLVGTNPAGVVFDGHNIWVANFGGNSVTKIAPGSSNTPISQTITFGPLNNITYPSPPFNLSATATSGLSVSFASTTPAVCTVSGLAVTISGIGTCTITASQAGNAFYSAAASVIQSFNVTGPVGSIYEVGDSVYGLSAIQITFSWDGNVSDHLTQFAWSTPLNNGATYGTLTDSDVALWDGIGFPNGITNLAVYLLSGQPTWSEDLTGTRIDLDIRDSKVGTYGFQLNRQADMTQIDKVHSGTLVSITTRIGPAVTLSASGLVFANQIVNLASAAQSVTVTNNGAAALIVTGISISGTGSGDFAETNNCGSSVAAGSSCTISITFTPVATGARIASIIINDNAANSPQSISLTGTGQASVVPAIFHNGIVPLYSTISAIQAGEWVSIYGSNLASGTTMWKGDFPTSLGGTTVQINGKLAFISLASPGQINLQAPNDAATGTVPVVVTTAAGSAMSTVTLVPFAPSFCLLDPQHVAAIILRSDNSGAYGGGSYDILGPTGTSLGYPTVAAKAGDIVALFGVGFGPTTPAVSAGQVYSGVAPTTAPVNLLINNVTITPSFAGLSSAGLYQINLTIPAGLGSGDVSLVATVGGVQTQTGVVISIQ